MIAPVKKSVNHSRTVASMRETGCEQQQKVRFRSDSTVRSEFRITINEVPYELFTHHASWCPKGPLKKFIETFSWYLYAGKLKTEQKLIVLPCLHSPPYLFSRKICTQSHSAEFLNWGDHVNSVPDLAASPPCSYPTRNFFFSILC